jgi:hypothetical protein
MGRGKEKFLDAVEVAEMFNLTIVQVLSRYRAGQFPGIKLGHHTLRFSKAAIIEAARKYEEERAKKPKPLSPRPWTPEQRAAILAGRERAKAARKAAQAGQNGEVNSET